MTERLKFVAAVESGRETMTALCARFGISRKTGYKILQRYRRDGPEGLRDQPKAPRSHPNQTDATIEGAVLRVRKAHPTWGSKKILAVLERNAADLPWPARSTIDAILKRAGLIQPRRRRNRKQPSSPPVIDATAPNDAWSMDYKGWFRVGDGTRCDPLTVNDLASRASLVCRAMVSPKLEDVKRRLDLSFRQYGLPLLMLSDNGPPFGSTGLGRLSRLGVWLLRLGVQPVFIEPGRPDQNGRHERFHETLKAETATPPKATIGAQQRAFGRFQCVYNEERPHEALGMRVPAEIWDFSPREMPDPLPEFSYPEGVEVRHVRTDGSIKWGGDFVFVGEAFRHEPIGIETVDDGIRHVRLGDMVLGVLHERSRTVVTLQEELTSVTHVPGHDGSADPEAT